MKLKKYLSIFVMFLFMLMAFPLSAIAWEEDELVIPASTKTHTAHPGAGFFSLDANRILTFMDENGNTQVIFGSGSTTFDTVDINGGTIDGTDIGAAVQGTGEFTSILGTSLNITGTGYVSGDNRGGVSTYAINGDVTFTYAEHMTGRVGEFALATSPTIQLDDLADVYAVVVVTDTTTAGDDSGVTVWSPNNKIHSGIGSTYTSGDTIFVNTGNTGFVLTLKAMSYSGVSGWKVWSFNGNTLRRP